MKTEVKIQPRHANGSFEIFAHTNFVAYPQAQFALALIERWGLITGRDDGEDTAGRAKTTFLGVEETVERAFSMAEAAYAEIERRGWMEHVPDMAECEEVANDMDDMDDMNRPMPRR